MNSKEIANGILRAVGIIVLVALGLYTLYLLQSIIIYLIVSLVLTLMGKPLIQFFYKKLKIKNKSEIGPHGSLKQKGLYGFP